MSAHLLLLALTLPAALIDVRQRRIPNWLVLAGLVAGFAWNLYAREPLRATGGLATGFALYLPLYLLRARGAGDVKLLAACGVIVGARECLWLFFLTALTAGAMAVVAVLAQGRTRRTLFNIGWMLRQLSSGRAPHTGNPDVDISSSQALRIPHALAIAAGSLALALI